MNDASDHIGGDRNENPDRYLVVLRAAAADLWSNWPSSCTTTTPVPSRADRAQRRPRPEPVVIALAALRFVARRRAESRSSNMDDGKTPERPRVEPEIIPPDRTRSARRDPSYVEMGGTHRVFVTRIGPLGGALLLLVIAVFVAAGGLLLFGALLIWLPLVALILIIGAITALFRPRRW